MEKSTDFSNLFIFELANNHAGDLEHGLRIVRAFRDISRPFDFNFAVKLQYRDIDTFIHPNFRNRKDLKYVKRFTETRLKENELRSLRDEIKQCGFLAICTPFDEPSVDLVLKHGFEMIKVGSCSFTDWPLLEKIVKTDLPVIASTAGATLEEIDQVVTFFEHRNHKFCVMHCVGEYPTQRGHLELNQIDLLRKRYPGVAIGFSTHEEPDNIDSIKMAIAKGARVFERHVAVESANYPMNAYSSTPEQIGRWLEAARDAFQMNGVEDERYAITEKESNDLKGLKRGVFAKADLHRGEKLADNVFYAIPSTEGQLIANDMSKYTEFILEKNIKANEAIYAKDLRVRYLREKVFRIIKELAKIVVKAHVALPNKVDLELSHHYGIDRYEEWGAGILNCINREYCKKLIILLPGQKHPFHRHLKKEETFYVLYGSMEATAGEERKALKAGDMLTLERGVSHNFSTDEGVIFEEVSTTHYDDDSFYEDETIAGNRDRKTELTCRSDWLYQLGK